MGAETARSKKPDAPPQLLGPYFALAALALASGFVPRLSDMLLPLSVAAFAFGLYISSTFRVHGMFAVCQFAMVLAAIWGAQVVAGGDRESDMRRREHERLQERMRGLR